MTIDLREPRVGGVEVRLRRRVRHILRANPHRAPIQPGQTPRPGRQAPDLRIEKGVDVAVHGILCRNYRTGKAPTSSVPLLTRDRDPSRSTDDDRAPAAPRPHRTHARGPRA